MFTPAPPYVHAPPTAARPSLTTLPVHLVHRILLLTLDQQATPSRFWSDAEEERVRRLWALFRGLRGVSRVFWLVATSILRAHYLAPFLNLIKPGYSSDPFPFESSHLSDPSLSFDPSAGGSVYAERGRETAVLDRFIAVRVGEELRRVESELSEGSGAEVDIFQRLQPAARIEDLLSTLPPHFITPTSILPSPPPPKRTLPLPQALVSISLTPNWAQVWINAQVVSLARKGGGKEMVLEVRRVGTLEGVVARIGEGLDDLRLGLVGWGGRVQ
ncbi:hypothetical protein L202_01859 [Cryptococcus amylolentus CBS 6039]|uniref:Uncharacterized protein n=2 Tax=Cryptococcus amylolentus TaxID=104669 RepID=A0A1E3HYS0_9TREE|nr:hypothetical protein L202_01859 [Cryptococcus amylolentus CBS 6039]ODN81428.1 hypothetical protein L202_01859 [Cryptococcus amylolentus CBS 6039]ODO10331.1 hypothetical protein I350_02560 [Cryptococcus amylolentus CBS 6273]